MTNKKQILVSNRKTYLCFRTKNKCVVFSSSLRLMNFVENFLFIFDLSLEKLWELLTLNYMGYFAYLFYGGGEASRSISGI